MKITKFINILYLIVTYILYLILFFFQDSFIANLLRIIQHMQPKTSKQSGNKLYDNIDKSDTLACKFPGLAIPNDIVGEENDPISAVMAELESFAPILSTKYD